MSLANGAFIVARQSASGMFVLVVHVYRLSLQPGTCWLCLSHPFPGRFANRFYRPCPRKLLSRKLLKCFIHTSRAERDKVEMGGHVSYRRKHRALPNCLGLIEKIVASGKSCVILTCRNKSQSRQSLAYLYMSYFQNVLTVLFKW